MSALAGELDAMAAPPNNVSFYQRKAAELRASASSYLILELQQGILDLADHWERLGCHIEAEKPPLQEDAPAPVSSVNETAP
jgi:hypothetical protein